MAEAGQALGPAPMPGRLTLSWRAALIGLSLLAAALGARVLTPTLHEVSDAPELAHTLPSVVAAWHVVPSTLVPVGVNVSTDTSINQPYNQSELRTYANAAGQRLYVAVAWGRKQRQEVKIHRPELCYPAQGFQVLSLQDLTFPLRTPQGEPVVGKRMLARDRNGQLEAVSYWIRIGAVYSDSAWRTRWHILNEGLAGRIPDGVLVRVSQRVADQSDLAAVYKRQEDFAAQLVSLSAAPTRAILVR
jgi:EpsI family protein